MVAGLENPGAGGGCRRDGLRGKKEITYRSCQAPCLAESPTSVRSPLLRSEPASHAFSGAPLAQSGAKADPWPVPCNRVQQQKCKMVRYCDMFTEARKTRFHIVVVLLSCMLGV
jgi:hypothetical protein